MSEYSNTKQPSGLTQCKSLLEHIINLMEEGLNPLVSQGQVNPLHSSKADDCVVLERWVDVEEIIIEEVYILRKLFLYLEIFWHYLQEFSPFQVFALGHLLYLFLEVKWELKQSFLNFLILNYSLVSLVTVDNSVHSSPALKQQLAINIECHYLFGEESHSDLDGYAGITRSEVKHCLVDNELQRKNIHFWIVECRSVVLVFEVAKKMHAFVLIWRDIQLKVFEHVMPPKVPSMSPNISKDLLSNFWLSFHISYQIYYRGYM